MVTVNGGDDYNLEKLKLEYSEANINSRHYSSLRFAIFTVYFALLSGLIGIAFGFLEIKPVEINNPTYTMLWARIGGFITTYLFLVLDIEL